ncbi:galactose mutarotase [Solitalea sp. MAHUQ-68]|uniref:Aldose 1-epimerase n=1 Tax=Solitalea agri TaxID=2953739 RepID=A0A9X2JCP4_9SPHI|nr:aldose epimerase family protein [Solitalea agri]MCO4293288.1 galactose mutarotase [Solitalea agri]
MQIIREDCGVTVKGQQLECITLKNDHETTLKITNYGGIIMSLIFFDNDQQPIDIVLGFEKVSDYFAKEYLENDYPYFGAVIGRYANRIKNGRFTLEGVDYQLAQTLGNDCLHGGVEGFDKKVWEVLSVTEQPIPSVTLRYVSPDGEENFPGNLTVLQTFSLTNENEVIIEFESTTDKTTVVNLTHHEYFNLNGGSGTIGDYLLSLNSSAYLEQDDSMVTNGNLVNVEGTAHDFRVAKTINHNWDEQLGYDQTFVIDKEAGELGLAAKAQSNKTGIELEILTTEPIVHLYTAAFVPQTRGKQGQMYGPFSAFCLETQVHPNALNIPSFPNTVLKPGEKQYSKTIYKLRIVE